MIEARCPILQRNVYLYLVHHELNSQKLKYMILVSWSSYKDNQQATLLIIESIINTNPSYLVVYLGICSEVVSTTDTLTVTHSSFLIPKIFNVFAANHLDNESQ